MPATRKPNPARRDCNSAMPTTPRDTLRMVLPAICTISSPRSLRIRRNSAPSPSTNRGAGRTRSGDNDRRDELKKANYDAFAKAEQRAAKWFELRRDLEQNCFRIGGGNCPQPVHLFTD